MNVGDAVRVIPRQVHVDVFQDPVLVRDLDAWHRPFVTPALIHSVETNESHVFIQFS